MTELVLFRAIQGLGAGALFPIVLAIIADSTARAREDVSRDCSGPCSASAS